VPSHSVYSAKRTVALNGVAPRCPDYLQPLFFSLLFVRYWSPGPFVRYPPVFLEELPSDFFSPRLDFRESYLFLSPPRIGPRLCGLLPPSAHVAFPTQPNWIPPPPIRPATLGLSYLIPRRLRPLDEKYPPTHFPAPVFSHLCPASSFCIGVQI